MRHAYVHEAELVLDEEVDQTAVGAAVTIALCGSCDHEGPCRWPNNHDADVESGPTVFRTIFVCEPGDEVEIRKRIERALRESQDWHVEASRPRPLHADEQELAGRLLKTSLPA